MKIWKLHTTKIRRGKKEKEHIFEVKIFKSKFDWHHLKYKLKQNRIKILKIQIGPKQCEEVLREKKWMGKFSSQMWQKTPIKVKVEKIEVTFLSPISTKTIWHKRRNKNLSKFLSPNFTKTIKSKSWKI